MSDLIDRQTAIDAVENAFDRETLLNRFVRKIAISAIRLLPSAEPERNTGKWLKISPAGIYECSRCGQAVMTSDIEAYKFCHGCGKKMEECG